MQRYQFTSANKFKGIVEPRIWLCWKAGDNISTKNNIGADIIAGFPTETDSMFDNSLKLVRACELVWLHVFPFSPRPNTPAARMPQLPAALIKERAARLRKAGARQRKAWLVRQVGRTLPVLLESPSRGRTEHFAQIALGTKPQSATQTKSSQLIQAHVTAHNGDMLYGEIV